MFCTARVRGAASSDIDSVPCISPLYCSDAFRLPRAGNRQSISSRQSDARGAVVISFRRVVMGSKRVREREGPHPVETSNIFTSSSRKNMSEPTHPCKSPPDTTLCFSVHVALRALVEAAEATQVMSLHFPLRVLVSSVEPNSFPASPCLPVQLLVISSARISWSGSALAPALLQTGL